MYEDVQMQRSVPEVLGVEKPFLYSPFSPAERYLDRADPLSSFAGTHIRIVPGGSNYEPCWFRRPAAEVEVSADVGSHEDYGESLSHLFPIISRALLAMVGVYGLGELHLPLHPSSVCLSVSNCPLYGDSHPVRGRFILMSSLDLHQLCEYLYFVCKVTLRYLGLRLQHLTLRGHDVTPHTLQRL